MEILLIDDDRDSLDNLTAQLEKRGFAIAGFSDPRQALEAAGTLCFNLVITDYEMPRINGLEVFKRIREISPEIPVIIISAAPEDKVRGLLHGACGYGYSFFSKPLDLYLLVRSLEKIRENLAGGEPM